MACSPLLPLLSCHSLLWYMTPGMGQGAPREGMGYIYIHLGGGKVRQAECGRQTGSGGLEGLGMNHRRIGAWQ